MYKWHGKMKIISSFQQTKFIVYMNKALFVSVKTVLLA